MDKGPTPLHGLWLSVFGVEALNPGHGLAHQLGAAALGLLLGGLVLGELRASRYSRASRASRD